MGTRTLVAHGALDHAELAARGLRPEDLIDFSSNLNPFGPPPSVRAALAALDPAPYPDRSCLRLRQALALQHGCDLAQMLPGNGSNELIHLIARALLRPGDISLLVGPTFGEYAHASQLASARVVEWRACADEPFAIDSAALADEIGRLRPRLTWLCAPNNPTGAMLSAAQVATLAEICAAHDGLLIVDRTYQAFVRTPDLLEDATRRQDDEAKRRRGEEAKNIASSDADARRSGGEATRRRGEEHRDIVSSPHRLVVSQDIPAAGALLQLHSFTKSYALAGLRLGHLLGAADLIARVAMYQPTWSVSSAAQVAGLAALEDQDFLPRTLPLLWAASDGLRDGLARLGLGVWRGELPFLLVRTGDGAATRAALLAHGFVVRDCASFGLPEWVRVAPRGSEENARLLQAWGGVAR